MLRKYTPEEAGFGCLFTLIFWGLIAFISEYGWIAVGIIILVIIIVIVVVSLPGTTEEEKLKKKYNDFKYWLKGKGTDMVRSVNTSSEKISSRSFSNQIILSISFALITAILTYKLGQSLYHEDSLNLNDTWFIWILFILIQAWVQTKIWKSK